MRYLPLPALLALVLIPAREIPPPAGALPQAGGGNKPCKLAGRVVNEVTGAPVRKAALTLDGHGPDLGSLTAKTDDAGRFSFENLKPGAYQFMAQKAGFLDRGAELVQLASGQETTDFELKLIPQAVISGKVLDEDGEPFPDRASVNVVRQTGRGAARTAGFAGQEMTNDLGEFRVAGLRAGSYIVSASAQGFRTVMSPGEKEPTESLVPTFYPGVTDAASATLIEVRAGQEVTGINITMRKSRVYRIEGRVAGKTTAYPLRQMSITLLPRENAQRFAGFGGGGGMVKPDGTFTIARVQPGAYQLMLMMRGDGRPQILGRTPVDVGGDDVTGVVVTIAEPLQISGSVRAEGDLKTGFDAMSVELRPMEGAFLGRQPAFVNGEGAFKIASLPPDRYAVSVRGIPANTYVKSVRLEKREAPGAFVDLTEAQGTVTIEILLGDKPGAVEGKVERDGAPAPRIRVMLVPDPSVGRLFERWRDVSTDQSGRFKLEGLAPGDYKLYAFEQSPDFEMMYESDALKPFDHKAVKVAVEEGSKAEVILTPIKPEDARPE